MSALEDRLILQCRCVGLPLPECELIFAPPRRFRFDLAWPGQKLACEVQGGLWRIGRHQRPRGFARDCEKRNLATLAGWRVLEVTREDITSGRAVGWIEQALAGTQKAASCT